jgi:hypothetical protein
MKTRFLVRHAAVVLAAVALIGTPAAASPEVRFEVPQPFRVAGHEFGAGVILLHSVSPFTPSTALLEVWVNGECLGLMTARRMDTEAPAGRSEAVFLRADDGSLDMIGFQVTRKGSTYQFP